jgi:tRNA threonylcarbamoyladenosine biosynthesis protein TsaB
LVPGDASDPMPPYAGRLLAIDTASGRCSVALLSGGRMLRRAEATAREHAALLLPMVDAVLAEAGLTLRALDGIAFGRGPGSFTGLRIAAAVTQGLAAGADLPVLPVSDLRALAEGARAAIGSEQGAAGGWLLACMDARMGELYWGLFRNKAQPVDPGEERLSTPAGLSAAVLEMLPQGEVIQGAAGRGLAAYPELAARLHLHPTRCFAGAEPDAGEIARLAACDLARGARWLDATAAQPVYLRDRVVQARL